jgi:hypothetical protein
MKIKYKLNISKENLASLLRDAMSIKQTSYFEDLVCK